MIIQANGLSHPWINIAFLVSCVFASCSSAIGSLLPESVKILLMLLWYVEVLLFEKKSFPTKFAIILLGWWMVEIVYLISGVSSASIGNYYITLKFFDIVIKSIFVLYGFSNSEKRILLFCIVAVVLETIIENIYYLNVYGDELLLMYRNINYYRDAGGDVRFANTGFYNSLIYFIGISFLIIRQSANKKYKLFFLTSIILSFYFMLSIETRATSFSLTVLLLVLTYYWTEKKMSQKALLISLAILLLLSLPLWLPSLISILPERVAVRISALIYNASSEEDVYLSRFSLMEVDLNTWFSGVAQFFFGVGDHRGHEHWKLIGQHSYILDMLAKYGFLGLLFMITFFRQLYSSFSNVVRGTAYKGFFKLTFIVFVINCITSQPFDVTVGITAILMLATIIPVDLRPSEY